MVRNPPANAGDTVQSLVLEDPTCGGATKPMFHKRSQHSEKPELQLESGSCLPQEKVHAQQRRPCIVKQ